MEVAEYGRQYSLARASNGEYMEKDGRRDAELTQMRGAGRGEGGERETTYMKSAYRRGSTRKTGTAPGTAMPFFARRLLAISAVVVFVALILGGNAVESFFFFLSFFQEGNRINALQRITGLDPI